MIAFINDKWIGVHSVLRLLEIVKTDFIETSAANVCHNFHRPIH